MSLKKLSEKGYTSSQLEDLRHLIQGEDSAFLMCLVT